jgi:hypothetical protein
MNAYHAEESPANGSNSSPSPPTGHPVVLTASLLVGPVGGYAPAGGPSCPSAHAGLTVGPRASRGDMP